MRRRKFNAFRNGKVHVCAKLCSTCIYKPDSPLMDVDIKQKAVKADNAVICHDTLDKPNQSVCRGFFENDKTPILHLAEALDVIVFE